MGRMRRALTIAGSDPSGGAGIQADLKTFHQFGVYGEAVITLLTVQNTLGVSRVETMTPELVIEQLDAVLADVPPQAAKTGALGSVAIIEALAGRVGHLGCPLVIDPVMISKHGAPLLAADAQGKLKNLLIPHAAVVTPNIPEAEVLSGMPIRSLADMGGRSVPRVSSTPGRYRSYPRDGLHLLGGNHGAAGSRADYAGSGSTGEAVHSGSDPDESGPWRWPRPGESFRKNRLNGLISQL